MAGWQSGHAAACKAVDAGSIPTPASRIERRRVEDSYHNIHPSVFHFARVVELVDTRDLKSLGFAAVTVRVRPRAPNQPPATSSSVQK